MSQSSPAHAHPHGAPQAAGRHPTGSAPICPGRG
jgi:hypothetical protein